MANVLVGHDEKTVVSVYVWGDENGLRADLAKPENATAEELKFTFKKMSHKDSNDLWLAMRATLLPGEEATVALIRDTVLKMFLIGWDVKDDGQPVVFDRDRINDLAPVVARVAADGYVNRSNLA